MVHRNAPLTETGRLRLARCVWTRLADRACRGAVPGVEAGRNPLGQAVSGAGLGGHGRPLLTPGALARAHAGCGGPPGGAPALEAAAGPGELVHVDIKKLGNIPDGGGWAHPRQGRGHPQPPGAPRPRPAAQGARSTQPGLLLCALRRRWLHPAGLLRGPRRRVRRHRPGLLGSCPRLLRRPRDPTASAVGFHARCAASLYPPSNTRQWPHRLCTGSKARTGRQHAPTPRPLVVPQAST